MGDTSTGEYTPKETPKVLESGPGTTIGAEHKKRKKGGVKAGSYNPRKRKGYEDMLKEAGSV